MACATAFVASLVHAGLVGEEPPCEFQRFARWHLVPPGAVGGIAAVLMLSVHPRLEVLAVAALVGVLPSLLGVFGFVARHM